MNNFITLIPLPLRLYPQRKAVRKGKSEISTNFKFQLKLLHIL